MEWHDGSLTFLTFVLVEAGLLVIGLVGRRDMGVDFVFDESVGHT